MITGASLVLTYDERLDEGSVPAAGAFEVKVDGSEVNLATSDAVAVSGTTVTLTLASAVTDIETVTLSYTVPAREPDPGSGGEQRRRPDGPGGHQQGAGHDGPDPEHGDGERRGAGADLRREPGRGLRTRGGRVHGDRARAARCRTFAVGGSAVTLTVSPAA